MAPCRAMICHRVTLAGDAEWPKVADAVIEAYNRNMYVEIGVEPSIGSDQRASVLGVTSSGMRGCRPT